MVQYSLSIKTLQILKYNQCYTPIDSMLMSKLMSELITQNLTEPFIICWSHTIHVNGFEWKNLFVVIQRVRNCVGVITWDIAMIFIFEKTRPNLYNIVVTYIIYSTSFLHFPIGVVLMSNENTFDFNYMRPRCDSMWGSKRVLLFLYTHLCIFCGQHL